MRYSGACMVLAAVVTFPVTALAQTGVATYVFTVPGVSASPTVSLAPNYSVSIPRYKNTGLVGITEYQLNYPTCTFISAGHWTPGSNVLPMDNGTPAGTVDVSQAAFTGPTPPGCDGSGGPYKYGPIYFNWTLHKNLTAVPNQGPIATFNSNWYTDDGQYNTPYSFQVTVPVVRPKGETNRFESWNEAKGRWRVTLVPPDNDPSFDFTGETVRETYLSDQDSCLGSGASVANTGSVKNGPPGNFGDSVGYNACIVEWARALKKTPCGYHITQRMEISAPSDGGTFAQYSMNDLYARIEGYVINYPGQLGIGQVSSRRVTPLSAPTPASKQFTTARIDCLRSLDGFLRLGQF